MKKSVYNIIQKIDVSHYLFNNSFHGVLNLLTDEQYSSFVNSVAQNLNSFYVQDDVVEFQAVRGGAISVMKKSI